MSNPIVPALRDMLPGRERTHYKDCWHFHLDCAVMRAADEIEMLQGTLDAIEAYCEENLGHPAWATHILDIISDPVGGLTDPGD